MEPGRGATRDGPGLLCFKRGQTQSALADRGSASGNDRIVASSTLTTFLHKLIDCARLFVIT